MLMDLSGCQISSLEELNFDDMILDSIFLLIECFDVLIKF